MTDHVERTMNVPKVDMEIGLQELDPSRISAIPLLGEPLEDFRGGFSNIIGKQTKYQELFKYYIDYGVPEQDARNYARWNIANLNLFKRK